jgi:hypothetical protein
MQVQKNIYGDSFEITSTVNPLTVLAEVKRKFKCYKIKALVLLTGKFK